MLVTTEKGLVSSRRGGTVVQSGKIQDSENRTLAEATGIRLATTRDCTNENLKEFKEVPREAIDQGYLRFSGFLNWEKKCFVKRCKGEYHGATTSNANQIEQQTNEQVSAE